MKIIIPSRSAANLTRLLRSLKEHEPQPLHVIIVDDGVDWPLDVDWNGSSHVIPGASPFCWARNINLGLAGAGQDDVLIVGDDVEWCEPILETLLEIAGSANIVAPAVDGFIGAEAQRWAPGLHRLHTRSTDRLCYVCVLIPAKVRERVGHFDERFIGYGYDDDDYNRRAMAAGVPLVIAAGVRVVHDRGTSEFRKRPDIQALYEHNARLYREKWGL